MTHRRARRTLAAIAVVGTLLLGPGDVVPAADARPRISNEQWEVRRRVNNTRANAVNRRQLRLHKAASARAQNWARQLANCRCLRHRNAPYGAPRPWFAAAENVGRGWSLAQVHRAFLRSAPHKKNILNRRMTHVATGVARAPNGEIFVVQAFFDLTR